jgi:hypothetical protein
MAHVKEYRGDEIIVLKTAFRPLAPEGPSDVLTDFTDDTDQRSFRSA